MCQRHVRRSYNGILLAWGQKEGHQMIPVPPIPRRDTATIGIEATMGDINAEHCIDFER